MSAKTLEIRLRKRVPGFELDVAWAMGDEIAVLFGRSGAGKSMTLNMLSGLMRPDDGRIVCGGEALYDSARGIDVPAHRRRIGYVFQECALFPHMTVRGNIEYALAGSREKAAPGRVDEIMYALDVGGLAPRRPSEISGGQRQRVALARALVGRPRLLMMDEPFTALDSSLRLQMRALVLDVRRRFGVPMLLVTHDIEEALSMADLMLIYSDGRISGPACRGGAAAPSSATVPCA